MLRGWFWAGPDDEGSGVHEGRIHRSDAKVGPGSGEGVGFLAWFQDFDAWHSESRVSRLRDLRSEWFQRDSGAGFVG